MRVYTDAATNSGVSGLGYVVELKSGASIEDKRYLESGVTSMEAEWFAMMQGLDVALHSTTSYDDCAYVYIDCKPLVSKMLDRDQAYDPKWHGFRAQTMKTLGQFDEWSITWEERASTSGNERADRLAREALWQVRDGGSNGAATEGVTFIPEWPDTRDNGDR